MEKNGIDYSKRIKCLSIKQNLTRRGLGKMLGVAYWESVSENCRDLLKN